MDCLLLDSSQVVVRAVVFSVKKQKMFYPINNNLAYLIYIFLDKEGTDDRTLSVNGGKRDNERCTA